MASKRVKLNAEDLEALKGAFTLIDTNSDGKLSISEFLALFKAQGMNYTEEELKKFFHDLKPDSNGYLDFVGFIKFMTTGLKNNKPSYANDPLVDKIFNPRNPTDLLELTVAFSRIDTNSDGRLSKSEFGTLFKSRGLSEIELDAFFYALEPDESGCINFNEFVKIMSGGYEPDEKIIAKNMFFDFDKDKDGLISFEEFKLMAKFFFKSANIDELQKDFNSIDLNGDGKLSLEEFVDSLESNSERVAKNAFYDMDADKDGLISFQEFKHLSETLNVSLNDEDLEADFEQFDEDDDGKINLSELLEWFSNFETSLSK